MNVALRSRSSARAFSLMEAAVVLAMVGLVAAAALTVFALLSRTMKSTQNESMLNARSHQPLQYLSSELQRAGGNGIPGQAAIVIEDNCAARGELPGCAGTDRVTVFTAPQAPVCRARDLGASADGRSYAVEWPQGGCCLRSEDFSAHVMLLNRRASGEILYRPVFLTGTGTDDDDCEFAAVDLLPPNLRHGGAGDFDGGDVVLVEMRTFYVDPATDELFLHIDNAAPPAPGAPTVIGKRMLIADHVVDLQVAAGLDVDDDGAVDDREWAFFPGQVAPADPRIVAPRMLWLGTVIGLPDSGVRAGNSVTSLLRGSVMSRPGLVLRSASTRVAPTNGLLGPGLSFAAGGAP